MVEARNYLTEDNNSALRERNVENDRKLTRIFVGEEESRSDPQAYIDIFIERAAGLKRDNPALNFTVGRILIDILHELFPGDSMEAKGSRIGTAAIFEMSLPGLRRLPLDEGIEVLRRERGSGRKN